MGRNQIILTGLEAHISIMQTSIELIEKGFDVFVPADTTGSRYLENYKAGLRRMLHTEVTITSSDATNFEWLRNANQEQYEVITRL